MKKALSPSSQPWTLAFFARRHRVDRKAVDRAVKNGRLERCLGRVGRRVVITDLALADREWEENRDPAKDRRRSSGKSRASSPESGRRGEIVGVGHTEIAPPVTNADPGGNGARPTIAAERRGLIQAQTKRAELLARKMSDELVDAEAVKRATFEAFRIVRDNVLNLSGRLAHEFASETDPAKIQARLDVEHRLALGAAADALEQAAHG
jgi:hypothetical protein